MLGVGVGVGGMAGAMAQPDKYMQVSADNMALAVGCG